jgi:uncharacterized membrane protein
MAVAFAMIGVPFLHDPESLKPSFQEIAAFWSSELIYTLNLFLIALYWEAYYKHFFFVKRYNNVLLGLNVLLLVLISSLLFTTTQVVTQLASTFTVVLFSLHLLLIQLVLQAIWWYATRDRKLVEETLNSGLVKLVKGKNWLSARFHLVATGCAFINVELSLVLCLIGPLIYIYPVYLRRV